MPEAKHDWEARKQEGEHVAGAGKWWAVEGVTHAAASPTKGE